MGQQQLLLIVLAVVIVLLAIIGGIKLFMENAVSENRDAVITGPVDLSGARSSTIAVLASAREVVRTRSWV